MTRPAEGLRPISEPIARIMSSIQRIPSYTAENGMVRGMFERRPMTTLEARKRIPIHAEHAIAGVCDDDTAIEILADLIHAIREAEGWRRTPPAANEATAERVAA
jgi:hypothetical protein